MNSRPLLDAGAVQIRPLVAADALAYKALRDEALRTAPDAFTSDYESSVGRDASEYVARFGALESGQFSWAPSTRRASCSAAWAASASNAPNSATARWWSA